MNAKRVISTTVVLWLTVVGVSQAAFENYNMGVKAEALGAYSALGDNPVVMLFNPAAMTRLTRPATAISYARPHIGFADSEINILSLFMGTCANGTAFGVGAAVLNTNFYYREIQVVTNYANTIGPMLDEKFDIRYGGNAKLYSLRRGDPTKSYDPALQVQTRTKGTMDLGVLVRYQNLYLGVSQANIVPANFGVVVRSVVPKETRVGLGIDHAAYVESTSIEFSPSLEFDDRNGIRTLNIALNTRLMPFLDVQTGASKDNLRFGFTVQPGGGKSKSTRSDVRIEASYIYPISGIDSAGSPQVGLVFMF